jgi:hypothetical protein
MSTAVVSSGDSSADCGSLQQQQQCGAMHHRSSDPTATVLPSLQAVAAAAVPVVISVYLAASVCTMIPHKAHTQQRSSTAAQFWSYYTTRHLRSQVREGSVSSSSSTSTCTQRELLTVASMWFCVVDCSLLFSNRHQVWHRLSGVITTIALHVRCQRSKFSNRVLAPFGLIVKLALKLA